MVHLPIVPLITIFIYSDFVKCFPKPEVTDTDMSYAFCGLDSSKSNSTGMKGRVLGGREIKLYEAPYLVSVQEQSFLKHHHKCGGSIYSEIWIITAAHCFGSGFDELDSFQIIAGEHHLEVPEESEQVIPVQKIITHPFYDSEDNNDIALLELAKPLKFNEHVKPIKIPPCNYIPKGKARLTGWGHVERRELNDRSHAVFSETLQIATVNVFSHPECEDILRKGLGRTGSFRAAKFQLHENAFCAGHLNKTIDSCQGDSGGPLACQEATGGVVLCGIVSYGFGCGLKYLPGIYTYVAHFHDWIVHVAGFN